MIWTVGNEVYTGHISRGCGEEEMGETKKGHDLGKELREREREYNMPMSA